MVMMTTVTSVTGELTWSGVFPVSGDRVGCIVPCDRMGCDRVGLTVLRIEVVVAPRCCVGI